MTLRNALMAALLAGAAVAAPAHASADAGPSSSVTWIIGDRSSDRPVGAHARGHSRGTPTGRRRDDHAARAEGERGPGVERPHQRRPRPGHGGHETLAGRPPLLRPRPERQADRGDHDLGVRPDRQGRHRGRTRLGLRPRSPGSEEGGGLRTQLQRGPDIRDTLGHGTHVASTVAGAGEKYRGVAPDAGLAIGKVGGVDGIADSAVLAGSGPTGRPVGRLPLERPGGAAGHQNPHLCQHRGHPGHPRPGR
ncbi:S8 family serine peptidase [Nonomuraea sp. NPDC050786]|uniref:S8 family serine peptidase n=1 Tax=Nonomuraea sp. NPDC050786 TaxID=3154840 RepID=UPI0033D59BA1